MIAAAQRRMARVQALGLKWSRRVDRRVDRLLVRAEPTVFRLARGGRRVWARWSKHLLRWGTAAYAAGGRVARWTGRRLRPLGVVALRALGVAERQARRAWSRTARASTRASAVITPDRALCGVIVAAAACLLASQLVDYRAVEVGRPGYAGLPAAARAPTVAAETPVDAHSYVLVAAALLAGVIGVAAARTGRRRLGRVVFALGLLSVAVVLLVDRPAGLDLGPQASLFAGADAVLEEGFYAQLASAAGLMLGGALLTSAPRARKSSLARTQGGRRSARTWFVRKRGGRPRTKPDDGLQRPAATMRGRA
jgi:hypothetical protein